MLEISLLVERKQNMLNRSLLLACIVFFIVLIWQLDALNVTIMEARNFATAREMVEQGNYLLPTLNGEYRLQKPPLPTWITAAFAHVFGVKNLFWLRLPAVLIGLLGLFYTMKIHLFLSRSKDEIILTGGILVTSFYFFQMARSGTWDIYAQSFLVMGIYYYSRYFLTAQEKWKNALLFGLCLAASIMSKGPVGLYGLFLPFLIAFHVIYRSNIHSVQFRPLIWSVALSILLSLMWPAYVYFSEAGQAAQAILAKESKNWSTYNIRPFYYYWSFPSQSGIWTLLGAASLAIYIRWRRILRNSSMIRFYFWWTILIIVLLSVIPEKKSRYLLPVLFPMALLISSIVQVDFEKLKIWLRVFVGVTLSVVGIVGIGLIAGLHEALINFSYRPISGSLLVLIAGYGIYMLVAKRNLKLPVYIVAISMILILMFHVRDVCDMLGSRQTVRSFASINSDIRFDGVPMYSIVPVRPEITFHLGRTTPQIGTSSIASLPDQVIIFSFDGIREEWPSDQLEGWDLIWEEQYDENPVYSLKKPNTALRRYVAKMKRIKE